MVPSRRNTPLRDLTTYRRSRAVRLAAYDYAGDADIHMTIHAEEGTRPTESPIAKTICDSVKFCSNKLRYRLYGYTLVPDHLHVLFTPAESKVPLKDWLQDFQSFTTNRHMGRCGGPLWQRSANDHVCRTAETAEAVLAYIVNNPVRAGLVARW
jgi:REP element-mobilizing transposase RayT